MEINIPLPSDYSINTYKELKNYLKQLELAVHHAQKAVESAENNGIEVTEDTFVCFRHPGLDSEIADNNHEELQHVTLQINLA